MIYAIIYTSHGDSVGERRVEAANPDEAAFRFKQEFQGHYDRIIGVTAISRGWGEPRGEVVDFSDINDADWWIKGEKPLGDAG